MTGKRALTVGKQDYWLPFPALNRDGTRLAAVSRGGTLTLWDAASGKELLTDAGRRGQPRFTPDGRYLLLDERGKGVGVWEAGTGKTAGLRLPPQPWSDLAQLSADGKRLALPVSDGKVLIWDTAAGKEVATVRGHGTRLAGVALSAAGDRLFTATGDDAAVKVWDATTGQELLSLRHARGGVVRLLLSPDGRRLATQGAEGTRVWDATPLPEGVVPK